jgi:hypothetical protein
VGFGFPFAFTQWWFKGIGSSVFFVVFPFLVVISLDEDGTGWQVEPHKDRMSTSLPVFSACFKVKDFMLSRYMP